MFTTIIRKACDICREKFPNFPTFFGIELKAFSIHIEIVFILRLNNLLNEGGSDTLATVKEYERRSADEEKALALETIEREIIREKSAITKRKRRHKILRVLAKHGLFYLLKDRSSVKLFRKNRWDDREEEQLKNIGIRMRTAFEELGPTFIKLGQVLVTRQDLLPEAITLELEKLLDQVPPIDFYHIHYTIEKELPEGMETFEWFDARPIGSASLAQVYRAGLKNGKTVAVKVVRPTVEKLFQTDIAVIKKMAGKLQKKLPPELQAALDLNSLVDDYYSSALNEIDMQEEARMMNEHRRLYAKRFERVHVPVVHQATKSVLIMEYIDGWTIKDFPVDFLTFEERVQIMVDLAHVYIDTMLNGHYHADAHGSNILIDRHTKKAVVIDWGMTGRLDSNMSLALLRSIMHIQLNQAEDSAETFMELMRPTIYTDVVKLKDELMSLVLPYTNVNQGNRRYNYGRLVLDATNIGLKNYCKVPNGLALWSKGFSATEGAARWLCPEISYGQVVETYEAGIIKSMISKRLNYRANASLLAEGAKLISTFPRRANKILEHLADNNMTVHLEVKPDPVFRNTLNQIVNRLSLALITFAVIVTTGLLLSAAGPGEYFGIGLAKLAAGGLATSIVLTFFMLWRIWRTRKHRSLL